MKVILSGSTGYIGAGVLESLLSHPSVTTILLLTRRSPFPPNQPPPSKAKVLILPDFTNYSDPALLSELSAADAAIWCLGTSHGDTRVDIDIPLAFIEAVRSARNSRRPSTSQTQSQTQTQSEPQTQIPTQSPPTTPKRPFRYIQLSGAFTAPPPPAGQPEKSLWLLGKARRIRGLTEAKVMEQHDPAREIEVTVVKPGGVLWKGAGWVQKCVFGDGLSVTLDVLGRVLVELAVSGGRVVGNGGGEEKRVWSNRDIINYEKGLREVEDRRKKADWGVGS